MKIDIAIGFNDVDVPRGIGLSPQNKPSYYYQLLCLIKSIKLNWNKNLYDYKIYAFHSRDLSAKKKEELISYGCDVVYTPNEVQPFINKENIYNHKTDGDYTLVLDSDMIVLNTPKLEFAKDIYAKKAGNGNSILSEDEWMELLPRMELEFDERGSYHFNGGCFLIRNSKKKEFYDNFLKYIDVLRGLEKQNRVMSVQIYYSMLINKLNWGFLDDGMNVFSHPLLKNKAYTADMKIDILHYLGTYGYNNEVKRLLSEVKDRYEEVC